MIDLLRADFASSGGMGSPLLQKNISKPFTGLKGEKSKARLLVVPNFVDLPHI